MPTIKPTQTATIFSGNYGRWYVRITGYGYPEELPIYRFDAKHWVECGGVISDPEHYLDEDEPVSAADVDRDSAEPLGQPVYRTHCLDHIDFDEADYYYDMGREG